jgi:hypothetical protein
MTDGEIVFMYKEGLKNPGGFTVLPSKDFDRLVVILNSKKLMAKYGIESEDPDA